MSEQRWHQNVLGFAGIPHVDGFSCSSAEQKGAAVKESAVKRLGSENTTDWMSDWLEAMGTQLRRAYLESTRALIATVEARDPFTERHSSRVSRYAKQIARRMDLSDGDVASVGTAAMLHDIGKIGIPDAILKKPGPLSDEEYAVVQRHPSIALDILGHTSYLRREQPLILHHHERYDGTGYPDRLVGDDIPIGARILYVADTLDAMLSRRVYRAPLSLDEARDELEEFSGLQFDPEVVETTLSWLEVRGSSIAAEALAANRAAGCSL